MKLAIFSSAAEGDIERCRQGYVAEWFEQALDRPISHQLGPESLISLSSYEDDWNFLLAAFQFTVKIRPRHARHGDIEDQTSGLIRDI
jgi:hypothetical protein